MNEAYTLLKQTCTDACHERHACAEGYRQMLASENVSQMMATWRANWEDVVQSKFADIICAELPHQYPALKAEMNQAGIYLNECPRHAKEYVLVLVTDGTEPIHIYGDARAYILADATVEAHDHSRVYNYRVHASVTLHDHAHGQLLITDTVTRTRFATLLQK